MVLGLTGWSAFVARRFLARYVGGRDPLIVTALPLVLILYTLHLYIVNIYGEREHLFFLTYLPFFLLRAMEARGFLISSLISLGCASLVFFKSEPRVACRGGRGDTP